jgi:carbonic anhydrase
MAEKVSRLPIVKSCLRHGDACLSIVRHRNTNSDEHAVPNELIQENVIPQLHHLGTHRSVAGRLGEGTLALSGGRIRMYHEEQLKFVPILGDEQKVAAAPSQ